MRKLKEQLEIVKDQRQDLMEKIKLCAKILTHFYESLNLRFLKNEVSNGDS